MTPDYGHLLEKLKWRRDYFQNIDFPMLMKEYDAAISAIEELQQRLQEVNYEDQDQEEEGIGVSTDDDEHQPESWVDVV